jgi:MFS family permease
VISIATRWKLTETALFSRLTELKKTSASPLADSVTKRSNLKAIVLALTIVAGASVVWHNAHFYSSIFIQNVLKVDFFTSALITIVALVLGAPFFVLFGRVSDSVGRLKIILAGTVLAALTFYPIYYAMDVFSHPVNAPALTCLVFLEVLFSAMCYGPLGAFLIEYFPARIRYTSVSISHGAGTGVVGDGTLVIAPFLALGVGNIYGGLIWSVVVPIIATIIAIILVKETKAAKIWVEVGGR